MCLSRALEYCVDGNLFNFPLYFTHHVPNFDERVKNQQSIFIFQLANKNTTLFQKIDSDYTIEVEHGHEVEILEQLKSLGFNKKFIYSDADNIAESVMDDNIFINKVKKNFYCGPGD